MPNEQRPLKVFLCHAHDDKAKTRELYRQLRRRGVQPWLDAENLVAGENWREAIPRAIRSSDAIIVCLSRNSINKEGFVQTEISFALEKTKEIPSGRIFLIPVRFETCEVPSTLESFHYVDLFEEGGFSRLMKSLRMRASQLERVPVNVPSPDETSPGVSLPEDGETKERERKLKELESQAVQLEAEGDLGNALKTWQEIKRLEPAFQHVSPKIKELQNKVAEKARRERLEISAARWAALRKTVSKVIPSPRAGSRIGMILILILAGIWIAPKLGALVSPPEATATKSIVTPTKTTKPKPTATPTRTSTPAPTRTRILTPTATSLSAAISDSKGVPMMFVPAGNFTMGKDDDYLYGYYQPAHTVYLDAFRIDKYEVTNARYKACVDADACTPPQNFQSRTRSSYYGNPEFDNYPVISVTWSQAKLYCEWRDGSLPTEAQWEKAARGPDGHTYPWGDEKIDCNKANANGCEDDSTEIGSYKSGVSPYGLYDMTGNVWEWVADYYSATYYKYSPTSNPLGPNSGRYRVVRGSSSSFLWGFQTYARGDAGYVVSDIGFRCAGNASP